MPGWIESPADFRQLISPLRESRDRRRIRVAGYFVVDSGDARGIEGVDFADMTRDVRLRLNIQSSPGSAGRRAMRTGGNRNDPLTNTIVFVLGRGGRAPAFSIRNGSLLDCRLGANSRPRLRGERVAVPGKFASSALAESDRRPIS